ncbi:MAG: GDSL-type esterase/lipase family protein [Dysgonamonadaceae bacterium]|jgi:lysophospholipase L1-like esterase|nr:GDSL-type esterase/lipase family protein [Dysgonamonadaceae bacterium]
MKKIFLLNLAWFFIGSFMQMKAESFPVTLKVIDQTSGQITNKVNDNNETNIFAWLDDNLKSQNPTTPGEWWWPMYNDPAFAAYTNGLLVKTESSWEWTLPLLVEPGTYEWNPYAKTLGWQSITPNMYPYTGDNGNNLVFTVDDAGSVSGHYELIIPDPATATKYPVTLQVIDYTKGNLTDAPGTWAQNANIVAWLSEGLNPGPYWFYGFFDTTVPNWDGQEGNVVTFPDGLLIKENDKWIWQATFQAAPGSYSWDPRNILLGWASIGGGNLAFTVSATGELSGDFILELGKPEPEGAIKVACIGDSNTAGAGVSNPSQKAWPVQMMEYLTEDYSVRNLGISGATLMNFPEPWGAWTNNASYIESLVNYNPGVVLVALGTNDSKDSYWGQRDFKSEYIAFIERFKNEIASHPEFYMIMPIKALSNSYEINNTNITEGIIPVIREISKEKAIPVIDWNSITAAFTNTELPDGVHANDETSRLMAQKAAEILRTPKPVISEAGQSEQVETVYAEYRWYKDGAYIENAASDSYIATQAGSYQVAVKLSATADDVIVSNPFTVSNATQPVTLVLSGTSTSIHAPQPNRISIYPNPAIGEIYISGTEGIVSSKLFDNTGRLLMESTQTQLNVSHLQKGLYLLQVNGQTLKVIKQ